MRNHCKRQRRTFDCRYEFRPDRCGDYADRYDCCDDYYDYADRYGDCCDRNTRGRMPACSFARWLGFSEGRQHLNRYNGFRVRFTSSLSEPEGGMYFRLASDGRTIEVCKSGEYEIRYSVLVPPAVLEKVEFFIARDNRPLPQTRSFAGAGGCGGICGAEAVVRLRGGSLLSLRSGGNYCAESPQPCTTMASMNISRLE